LVSGLVMTPQASVSLPVPVFPFAGKVGNQYFTIHEIAPFIEAYHLEFTPSQGYFLNNFRFVLLEKTGQIMICLNL